MVDSQAEISLIKLDSLGEDQIIDTSDWTELTGITSGCVRSHGSTLLKLFLSRKSSISHAFQVVDRNFPIPFDGILGKDFIWRYDCTICALNCRFTVRTNDQEFIFPFLQNIGVGIRPTDTISVPPRHEFVTKVNLCLREDSVIKPRMIEPGVFLAGAIVSKKNCFVRIVNTTTKTRFVNTNVIQLEPLSNYQVVKVSKNRQQKSERTRNILNCRVAEENMSAESIKIDYAPTSIKEKLAKLCNRYRDVFFLPGDRLSVNNFYKQSITPVDDTPVFRKNFRMPKSHEAEVDRQVQAMLDDDIIEDSVSAYNSPVFLVPKKGQNDTKKWRLVVDFRELNKKIPQDRFPLPRIEDILDSLGKAKFFSTLDLQSGFHQIEVEKNSRKFTSFSTHKGHFQFKRLPFGLNISPNCFQRMMSIALSGLPPETAFLYIDDIIVLGYSETHHLENLEKVFEKLKERNLKLNPSKCNFFRTEVTFLGHKVTAKGILPDDSMIGAVKDMPVPIDAAGVKRFVAFANFYRRFVPNFSVIAAPLHAFSKKHSVFEWTDKCQQAFDKLRTALSSPPILNFPDFDKEFVLVSDASDLGCGAKLAQVVRGVEMPVAFASKAFKNGDLTRPPIEKEMMGIYFGITHFKPYLYGRKFLVKTDHKPLVHMWSIKNPTSRIINMRLELGEFDFDVEYIPGPDNVEADALSRVNFGSITNPKILAITRSMAKRLDSLPNPGVEEIPIVDELGCYEASSEIDVKNMPLLKFDVSDVALTFEVRKARRQLFCSQIYLTETNTDTIRLALAEIQSAALNASVRDMRLAANDDVFRYVSIAEFKTQANDVLKDMRIAIFIKRKRLTDKTDIEEVLQTFHDDPIHGHPGQQRLLQKLKKRYVWKNMRGDVKRVVNSCEQCKLKKHEANTIEKLIHTTTPARPFDVVSVDLVGPESLTAKGNRFILTMQCDFSKYVMCVPIPNKEAVTVAKAMVTHLFLVFGAVKTIKSDLGSEFVNQVLDGVCRLLNTDRKKSTAYHPQTIGGLERNHRVLNEFLRNCLPTSSLDWDEWVPFYAFAYNSTPHTVHKFAPWELVFGRQPTLPTDILTKVDPIYNHEDYVKELKFKLQLSAKNTAVWLDNAKTDLINKRDKINPITLSIGSKVKLRIEARKKFDDVYEGPFEVINIQHPNVTIKDKDGKEKVVHKNRIILY